MNKRAQAMCAPVPSFLGQVVGGEDSVGTITMAAAHRLSRLCNVLLSLAATYFYQDVTLQIDKQVRSRIWVDV